MRSVQETEAANHLSYSEIINKQLPFEKNLRKLSNKDFEN